MAVATVFLLFLCSCTTEEQYENTPEGNFEALWTLIDEHYCFLDYKKKTIGLDWNEVHSRYRSRIDSKMKAGQLFEVLAEMLGELRDGHVNLYATHNMGRNWSWYEDYPRQFSKDLQDSYLGTDYKIASSLYYRILEDNIGYVVCSSFSSSFGEGNLDEVLYALLKLSAILCACNHRRQVQRHKALVVKHR